MSFDGFAAVRKRACIQLFYMCSMKPVSRLVFIVPRAECLLIYSARSVRIHIHPNYLTLLVGVFLKADATQSYAGLIASIIYLRSSDVRLSD